MGRKDKQLLPNPHVWAVYKCLSDRNYHQQQYTCFHQPVLSILRPKAKTFY